MLVSPSLVNQSWKPSSKSSVKVVGQTRFDQMFLRSKNIIYLYRVTVTVTVTVCSGFSVDFPLDCPMDFPWDIRKTGLIHSRFRGFQKNVLSKSFFTLTGEKQMKSRCNGGANRRFSGANAGLSRRKILECPRTVLWIFHGFSMPRLIPQIRPGRKQTVRFLLQNHAVRYGRAWSSLRTLHQGASLPRRTHSRGTWAPASRR